jgi:threonine synthase
LKDPDTAIKHSNNQFKPGIEPTSAAVAEAMGL